MNRNYLLPLFAAVLVVFLADFSCASQKTKTPLEGEILPEVSLPAMPEPKQGNTQMITDPQGVVIQGMIKLYGNEPHAMVGIETFPDKKIYLVMPPERAAELRRMQSRLMEFDVILGNTAMPGLTGTATILAWRIVQ